MQLISYCINYTFSERQSPVIYQVCTPWNAIFKGISYAQTINITPTWIHLWADLAEKPKRMCRAMITSFTKFGQHPMLSISYERTAMCSHTYTCISDPQPFLHRNKINTLKKFIKILRAYNKSFICILPLIHMKNTQSKCR